MVAQRNPRLAEGVLDCKFRAVGVIVEATLEIPEPIARSLGYTPDGLPRRALEALLVDECARGRITRGKVAEILGLSFYDAEELFRASRVPYPAKTQDDDLTANGPLTKSR